MNREAIERVAYHAALLAGEGARARETAYFVGAAARTGEGRSCLDAGASLQLFLDAPGPPSLRFAVRLDDAALEAPAGLALGLADDDDVRALVDAARTMALPRAKGTFGLWFLRDEGATLAADMRGGSHATAAERLRPLLASRAQALLDRYLATLDGATPWAVILVARGGRVGSVQMRWSLARGLHPARVFRSSGWEDAWDLASDVLTRVLGEPPTEHTRPWQVVTRLDEEGPVCFATSAWSRRLDLDAKRERLVSAFEALGGPSRQVDATWRLLRQFAPEERRWTIGRGLEVRADRDAGVRLRAVLVPAPDQLGGAMAGKISSSSELTTGGVADADPKRS
jgi:hypothetical protein